MTQRWLGCARRHGNGTDGHGRCDCQRWNCRAASRLLDVTSALTTRRTLRTRCLIGTPLHAGGGYLRRSANSVRVTFPQITLMRGRQLWSESAHDQRTTFLRVQATDELVRPEAHYRQGVESRWFAGPPTVVCLEDRHPHLCRCLRTGAPDHTIRHCPFSVGRLREIVRVSQVSRRTTVRTAGSEGYDDQHEPAVARGRNRQ